VLRSPVRPLNCD